MAEGGGIIQQLLQPGNNRRNTEGSTAIIAIIAMIVIFQFRPNLLLWILIEDSTYIVIKEDID